MPTALKEALEANRTRERAHPRLYGDFIAALSDAELAQAHRDVIDFLYRTSTPTTNPAWDILVLTGFELGWRDGGR